MFDLSEVQEIKATAEALKGQIRSEGGQPAESATSPLPQNPKSDLFLFADRVARLCDDILSPDAQVAASGSHPRQPGN